MILLALGLAVSILLALLGPRAPLGRAGFGALLLAYLLPAAVLAWVFRDPGHTATRFRFALVGLGGQSTEGKPVSAELSGDRAQAGVWISALREGAGAAAAGKLVFTPVRDEAALGTLHIEASGQPAPAFLALRQGGPLTPLESLELADGDRLQIGGRSWRFTTATGFLGPPARFVPEEGEPVDVPPRRSTLPFLEKKVTIPWGRPLPPSQETYFLAWLEKGEKAFLYRREGGFFLSAPAGRVTLERGGKEISFPRTAALGSGDALHLVSFPRWNEQEFAAGGWRDRRSFRADLGRRSFALAFDTPEVHSLPWKPVRDEKKKVGLEDLAMVLPGDRPDQPLRVSLSFGDWDFADRSLHFASAGRRVAGEALATLELPRDPAAAGDGFSTATPRGQRRARFGQPFWLGGENAAAVQADIIALPFLFGLFALALAPLKAWAAREAGFTRAHLAAAAALEVLLAVRVLLGFRAWALAPHSEEAMRLALIAWGLLPWALLAAAWPRIPRRSYDEEAPTLRGLLVSPAAGGLFFAAAWAWAMSGGGVKGLVWWGVALALLALPVLAGGGWLERPTAAWAALGRRTAAFAARLPRAAGAPRRWLGDALPWVAWAFVPTLLRGVLFFLGAKESLQLFGQRLALTLVHVPLAVVLEAAYLAWLWRRAGHRGAVTWRDLAPAAAFLLFTWAVPGLLVSDLGLILLNVPVFLLALLALLAAARSRSREERGEDAQGFRRAALATGGVFALLLALTAFPAATRLLARGVALVHSEEWVERNYLRVLAFAYPEELGKIARRSSEELAVMNAVMASYTSRPWEESRYLTSETSPHLQATALREHVPAVLLAAEWTAAGVFGVLLLYVSFALAGTRLAPWRVADDGGFAPPSVWRDPAFFRLGAGLAALTFALPSVYMILANYRLTLFTGKNVYLLGLDSMADVLESLLLAALFAAFAARAREAEEEG